MIELGYNTHVNFKDVFFDIISIQPDFDGNLTCEGYWYNRGQTGAPYRIDYECHTIVITKEQVKNWGPYAN